MPRSIEEWAKERNRDRSGGSVGSSIVGAVGGKTGDGSISGSIVGAVGVQSGGSVGGSIAGAVQQQTGQSGGQGSPRSIEEWAQDQQRSKPQSLDEGQRLYEQRKQAQADADPWTPTLKWLGGIAQQAEQARNGLQVDPTETYSAWEDVKDAWEASRKANRAADYAGRKALINEYNAAREAVRAGMEAGETWDPALQTRLDQARERLYTQERIHGNIGLNANGELQPMAYSFGEGVGNFTSGVAASTAGVIASTAGWLGEAAARSEYAKNAQQLREMEAFYAMTGNDNAAEDARGMADTLTQRAAQRGNMEEFAPIYQFAGKLTGAGERMLQTVKENQRPVVQMGVDVGRTAMEMGFDAMSGMPLVSMGVRVFGSSTQEARDAGASFLQQGAYGAASAGIEVMTETIGGLKLYGGGQLDEVLEPALREIAGTPSGYALVRALYTMAQEGNEEVLSDLLQPLAQSIYNGQSVGENYSELQLKDILYDWLLGAASAFGGAVVESGGYAQDYTAMREMQQDLNAHGVETGRMTDEQLRQAYTLDKAGVNVAGLQSAANRAVGGKTIGEAYENMTQEQRVAALVNMLAAQTQRSGQTQTPTDNITRETAQEILRESLGEREAESAERILDLGSESNLREQAIAYHTIATEYGQTEGRSVEDALRSNVRGALNDTQVQHAYAYGESLRKSGQTVGVNGQTTEQGAQTANPVRRAGLVTAGTFEDGNTTYKAADLSKADARDLRILTDIAKAQGVDFVLYESELGEADAEGRRSYIGANGAYRNGVVYLDINAGLTGERTEGGKTYSIGQRALLVTAAHELTHHLEHSNATMYRQLRSFVTERLGGSDSFIGYVREAMAREDISVEAASREVVARACEEVLLDEDAIRELQGKKPTLWEQIKEWVKDFVKKFESASGEAVEMRQYANELRRLWLDTATQSAETITEDAESAEDAERKEAVSEANATTQFSLKNPVEETDRLVAIHNKSVSGLRRMLQRGGVPFPSIAIKKAGTPHEGFGEVSIVFPRSTIDPNVSKWNRLYSNDAWTPTEPRTEYEVVDTWKLRQQMEEELGTDAFRATQLGSHLEENQLARDLETSEGDIVRALKGKTGIKYAYLKSIGQEPEAARKEKPLDGFGRYKNAQLRAVFETIPAAELKAMNYDSTETLQKVADVLQQQFIDSLPSDAAKRFAERRAIYTADKINPQIIKDALRNYEASGGVMESEIDDVELNRVLRDNKAIEEDPQYQEWIRNRFGNLIKDSGIPNGKGIYTDTGNRRSFKARHVPATLENIVAQMRKEQETGIGLGGINLRGAATKAYSSVEEMRRESGKLLGEHIFDEEYDSYMKEFGQRLNDLTEAATKTSYDVAKQTLLETVRDSKNKADMKRRLQNESRWIRYSDELTDDLWQLKQDVQNMPAPYFEAKPRRVVSTDEALAYIVPDNADPDVLDALNKRGYNVMTYKAGDEGDRLAKLNSVEGAQFSVRSDAMTDREILMLADAYGEGQAELTEFRDAMARYQDYDESAQEHLQKLSELQTERKAVTDMRTSMGEITPQEKQQRLSALDEQIATERREATKAEQNAARALDRVTQLEKGRALQDILQRERAAQRQRTRAQVNESARRRDTRRKVEKLAKELQRRVLKPSEKRYIPADLMRQTVDVLQAINLDSSRPGTKSGEALRARLLEMQDRYRALETDETYKSASYDPTVAEMLKNMVQTVGDTPINKMTAAQLESVYNTLRAMTHVIQTGIKVKIAGEERDAWEVAHDMTRETRSVNKPKDSRLNGWLNLQLSAERMFRRLGNYTKNSAWEKVYRMLNDGQLKMTLVQMEGAQIFADLIGKENAKAYRELNSYKDKDLVDVGLTDVDGNSIKISHGMMVSLYMHLLNEQNARHVARGGLTIPDLKGYYKGADDRGFGSGERRAVGVSAELAEARREQREAEDELREAKQSGDAEAIQQAEDAVDAAKANVDEILAKGDAYLASLRESIEKQLTDYERDWIAATQELMDGYSKDRLNETTLEVYGIKKARVENYYPIKSDKNFTRGDFEAVSRNMSLENVGFMKERVEGTNPMYLMDVADVVNTQISNVAQYCGLMPAIRSFNKIWNKSEAGNTVSLKDTVNQKFGQGGLKYVENLIADLQGARRGKSDGLSRFLSGMRGNMAGANLTISLNTALAQAASYPTAAAEIGWTPLIKAFFKGGQSGRMISRADRELIAKYTPLLWTRLQGYSTVELGDLAGNNQLAGRVFRKMRFITGWIQAMDTATVGRLWYAAQYYVDAKNPELQKGSDAYYKATAKIFNDIVEKTQPDYTTMQRPDILRNPNELVRSLTMFMTQRLQNFNIVYDSIATAQKYRQDYRNGQANGVTAEDVKQAQHESRRAVVSQIAAGATIVVFKTLSGILQHALDGYRDDDKELTAESISFACLDMFLDTMASNFLWGGELYDVIESAITGNRYYGLEVNGVQSISDILSTSQNLFAMLKDYKTLSWDKVQPKFITLAKKLGPMLGLPIGNAVKLFKGVWLWGQEFIHATEDGDLLKAFDFEEGVERGAGIEANRYVSAWLDGDRAKMREIIGGLSVNMTSFNSQLSSEIGDRYKDGSVNAAQAIRMLQELRGMTPEEAAKTVNEWKFKVDTGIEYDKIKEQLLNGSISVQRAAAYWQKYGGMSAEDATLKANYVAACGAAPGLADKLSQDQYKGWYNYARSAGVKVEVYAEIRSTANTDEQSNINQPEAAAAITRALNSGQITRAQAEAVWKSINKGWTTTYADYVAKHK